MISHAIAITVGISFVASISSLIISIRMASMLEQRMERESILGDIAKRYGEIREVGARGALKIMLVEKRFGKSFLGTLSDKFKTACRDSHSVFLEAFQKRTDLNKLQQVKTALDAIKGNMLRMMEILEFKESRMRADFRA